MACSRRRQADIHKAKQGQAHEESAIETVRAKGCQHREEQHNWLKLIEAHQAYHRSKVRNVIEKMSRDTLNNDSIKRRQHVFNMWKNYVHDKQRVTKKLVILI